MPNSKLVLTCHCLEAEVVTKVNSSKSKAMGLLLKAQ